MDFLIENAMGSVVDEMTSVLQGYIQQYIWIIVLISLPALALAVANCFFGVKIFRVLLVINGVVCGGLVGALTVMCFVLANGDNPIPGMIIAFILAGALCGALAWFAYKVFLFIHCFFLGVGAVTVLTLPVMFADPMGIMSKMSLFSILGIIIGIVLGVLSVIYTKPVVMGITAYNGASTIASVLSLFFLFSSAYGIVYYLLFIGFAAGGFAFQYISDKKHPADFGAMPGANRQNVQTANNVPQQSNMAQPVTGKIMLKGIDGIYKGFEFDIDKATVFGRDPERCNIIFPDKCVGVSKIQCELDINFSTGAVAIMDKFSSYGTTVNGEKLGHDEKRYLNPGDIIMFGENNVFKIEYM